VPQTLLLADDSTTIQRVIELTFAAEDIQVISVSDGDQAIARLQSSPPDIVLADVGMPGKTGYEVAEYIKQHPQLAHIPVVLLTGAFEPVDQAKAAAVGCDGVLAKPFEPQIVIGRVRELLGRASTAAAGNPPAPVDKPVSNIFEFAPAASPEPASTELPSPEPEPQVEDYFDRLDAAFAARSNAPVAAPDISLAPPPVPVVEASQDFAIADAFAAEPAKVLEPPPIRVSAFVPEPEPPPATEPEPEPIRLAPAPAPIRVAAVEPEPEPIRVVPEPVQVTRLEPQKPLEPLERLEPHEPRGPKVLPSIADAFSAILAAEQNALGVKPEWPSSASQSQAAPAAAASAAPAELVITDDLIDRVARRVLEQMSDRIVRETVADLASQTAERLVREEIERIKSAIK
jgi:CheY-like chemotaxis protein